MGVEFDPLLKVQPSAFGSSGAGTELDGQRSAADKSLAARFAIF
jgi:hypothetical protein